jgi:predicted Fe-S protein YdhL (DUF1289 family)
MKDKITITAQLVKHPCMDPNSICKGCFLRIGILGCANRSLCPNTKEENVNWQLAERVQRIKPPTTK